MATTYLTLTKSTGSMIAWTWSAWVKRGVLSTEQNLFTAYNASTDYTEVRFDTSDRLNFQNKVAGAWAGELQTRRVFRDTAAWYNIVIVWDTGNATGADRIRMYVNGVRETDFIGTDVPTLNKASNIGEASIPTHIGSFATNSKFFDGSMSDVCFIDGQALTASSFGETDTDTGEWTIKDASGLTFGTNGYMILRDGNTITDQSSNSNNFTLGGGTLTATEDCPSDVLNTFSPLYRGTGSGSYSLSNGNTTFLNNASSPWANAFTSIGNSTGKFYTEFLHYTGTHSIFGIINSETIRQDKGTNDAIGSTAIGQPAASYYGNSGQSMINGTQASFGSAIASGDYVGMAVDLTNSKIYFSKNGVWQGSGDPSTGSNGLTITGDTTYVVGVGGYGSGGIKANFGNGSFGTTQLTGTTYSPTVGDTSAIFKYDVPTGYTALSTKGLNS